MSVKIGTLLSNNMYRVTSLLGKGAMGNVYLVKKIESGDDLVVKELEFSPDSRINEDSAREIFFREAEFIAKFDHPGLPKTYGIFIQDGRYYITMEYIKGETLEEVLNKSDKPIPLDKAVKWVIELGEILDYLHNSFEAPIVYRDLKPANIIITPFNKPRLIDFGISRYYNPDKHTDTFRLGSPGYAAPEQYKGRGQSNPQTDVFALGVILFQMLTKYDPTLTPFKFPSIKSLNPSIPDKLESVINRAIQLDQTKRYISIMEFKKSIQKCTGIKSIATGPSYESPIKPQKHTPAVTPRQTPRQSSSIPPVPVSRPQKKSFTFIEFMIVMAIISIIAAGIMPSIIRKKPATVGKSCVRNIKNLATAMELYACDNKGKYPVKLSYLSKYGYISSLPSCPETGSLEYLYTVSSNYKNFTICCPGKGVHKDTSINYEGHYPQYSHSRGLVPSSWRNR